MKKWLAIAPAVMALWIGAGGGSGLAQNVSRPAIAAALTEALAQPDGAPVAGTRVDRAMLKAFYQSRANAPAWVDDSGAPTKTALAAIGLIDSAGEDGLNPQAYHATAIEALARPASPTDAANFDLLLSDGFAAYMHDLRVGRVSAGFLRDPSFTEEPFDKVLALTSAMALAPLDLRRFAGGLCPPEPDYWALRQALADLRQQQAKGGWQSLPDGPSLKPGMKGPRVALLRQRLGLPPGPHPDQYGDDLAGAVKAFQETHVIKDDGALGHDTRAALNMPVEGRIAEVIATLERLRWLPHDLGPRTVMVDVDGFWLRYAENGQAKLQLPVIVGTTERETPLLRSEIRDAVINPTWTVPPTIIKKDILPKLRADPGYLATRGIKLYRRTDSGLEEVTPREVDYHGGGEYVLRQPAGDENPLGKFKLLFPNPYSIYLHDTPEQKKFSAALRTFSSGCIRVENVRQLVEALLAGQKTPRQIDEDLASGKTKTIPLTAPAAVYITYLSAWLDAGGHLIFGPDLYDKDLALAEQLQAVPETVIR